MLEAAGSDSSEFEQLFEKACPKFVSGVLPNFGTGSGDNDDDDDAECMSGSAANLFEPVRRQILLLGKEAASVAGHTNKLRSFLKLYTAIEIEKLAKFQAASEGTEQTPKTIRADLMATKHLMAQVSSPPHRLLLLLVLVGTGCLCRLVSWHWWCIAVWWCC
jgi:hypothetical protein